LGRRAIPPRKPLRAALYLSRVRHRASVPLPPDSAGSLRGMRRISCVPRGRVEERTLTKNRIASDQRILDQQPRDDASTIVPRLELKALPRIYEF
jgi:hypothetical protein